jgi:hypothetical protein
MTWLQLLPPFRKSGDKIMNAAHIPKALAMQQPIFKPKRSGLSSQDVFL